MADEFDLTGRVAFVTGASRGIGRAIARALARHGAVIVAASRKVEGCEAVAAEIRAAGGQATALACHIGEPEQISAALQEIDRRHGRLDILVNNAATNPYFGPALDMELSAYQKTVDVNIRGYFWTSVEAARRMVARGKGAIVNVASVNAFRPMDGQAVYSMTKAAIVNMTQALAREWARQGVRVNALVPGLVETRFAAAIHENERLRSAMERLVPMGRIAQPEEMAGAVVYLVSDAASYTTGSCLTADGGWLA
ncbi:MAG TPA: SDR family oxidoreductase [Steroidobacteraceae bacterium]|jgi:NAD(P)-dependent dehydrogenase (short-subunit alcohol dehydrogenase family)